jgi:hypothetical protein
LSLKIQHQKRPCGQFFFPFWSNQDEVPRTVLCCWNIQRQPEEALWTMFFFILVESG